MPQKTSIGKKEKRAPGFKAPFRANIVEFLIRTALALIYKAANP